MRQLMTQGAPDSLVIPIPVIGVSAQAQLDDLASVAVKAQRPPVVRRVRGRVHLGEEADGEAVGGHGGADAGVGGEAGEEGGGARGVREVGER